tara:strand:+ start:540 stop:1229 length:690 start_codon:yes stop_codon:yes gene_type:complete
MKIKKFLGIGFIVVGFVLVSFQYSITGAIIGASVIQSIGSILGLAFVIGGVGLLMARREIKEGNLARLLANDKEILEALPIGDREHYVPREKMLEKLSATLEGDEKFYINPLRNGDVIYVHLTSKEGAKSIIDKGLKHRGKSTYGQALIFTGKDALVKSREFVDSLSRNEKYIGVSKPTNAIIFRTDIIPYLNQFSGVIKNYPGRWKAMFKQDIPESLMYDVENMRITA